jgi:y4mF family transcriptional regulator
MINSSLVAFIKKQRRTLRITQPELARQAGVGLRFVRELEQGKATLRVDKVNQVLALFGHRLGAVPMSQEDRDGSDR